MFDDEEGGEWQHEPEDWWHNGPSEHDGEGDDWQQEPDNWWQYGSNDLAGGPVQAAVNARLKMATRLTFFDDENGEDDM